MAKFNFVKKKRFFLPLFGANVFEVFPLFFACVGSQNVHITCVGEHERILRVWTWAQELYRFVEMPHNKHRTGRGKSDESEEFNWLNQRFFPVNLPQALVTHKKCKKSKLLSSAGLKFILYSTHIVQTNEWKKWKSFGEATVWLCAT